MADACAASTERISGPRPLPSFAEMKCASAKPRKPSFHCNSFFTRARVKNELQWKLGFLSFAEAHFISAKDGKGLGPLMRSVDAAHAAAMARIPTPKLTRAMQAAVERQSPPKRGLIRPKLRYAHQGGVNPPRVIIHGNALDRVPDSYKRYLEGYFRKEFQLVGTPLAIEFRTGRNPYAGKKRKSRS